VLTATHQMARDLGWGYFEKLAKQKVMQVQSAADPPKKLALGERAIMVDGSDYLITRLKEKGEPVEFVHAAEGTPLITGPAAIMKSPPNPNAARLFTTGRSRRRRSSSTSTSEACARRMPWSGSRPAARS